MNKNVAKQFKCKRCGHCCKDFLGGYCNSVGLDYINFLEENGRGDILKWICQISDDIYDYWIHPRIGDDVSKCPWLKKEGKIYTCKIQGYKPPICANYPLSKTHAKETGCKGFSKEERWTKTRNTGELRQSLNGSGNPWTRSADGLTTAQ